MAIQVIVMGALGRMGSTIVNMVKNDPVFELTGCVVLEGELGNAKGTGFPVSAWLEDLLERAPQATILDFTTATASVQTAEIAAKSGARHVIGTTGFTANQKKYIARFARQTPIFLSPNMSVGVNVLLKILPDLTRLLGDQYDLEMMEIHHNKKRDSPSGTALRLAECLAEAREWELRDTACYHREGMIGERPAKQLGIQTLRGGDVVGDHTVYFFGPGERISITHQAHSRENFAKGALRAARWLQDQPAGKIYSMQDMLR